MTDSVVRLPVAGWQQWRWLPGVLIASLALNLIVAGIVVGVLWRHHPQASPGPHITPNLLGFTNTLAPERRKQLMDATADARQELRPFRRDVRLAREEVFKVLVQDPFDKAGFMAAQTHLADAESRGRSAVNSLYGIIAAHLTPEERRGFKRWREYHRPPGSNLLDEPDRQAGDPIRR
jgi:uncharacterized membrane protein